MKVVYANYDADHDSEITISMKSVEELSQDQLERLLSTVLNICSIRKMDKRVLDLIRYYFEVHSKEEIEAAAKLSEECSVASPHLFYKGKYGYMKEISLYRGKIKKEDLEELYPSSDAANPDFFMKISLPARFKTQIEQHCKGLKTEEQQREEKRKKRKIRAAQKLLEKEGIKVQ